MNKNILVLTGSPRDGGNSGLLADHFIEGATTAGHKIVRFDAGTKQINGCIACNKCFSKGQACIFNDGFNDLAVLLENADIIVIVTPLYFYSFTAQIKAAIDKIYSFYIGGRPFKIKECLLITCGETDKYDDFDGLVKSYQLIAGYVKWEDKGTLIVTDVNKKGDIIGSPSLDLARELGMNISQ